jgi:hypothetical protein
LRGIREYIADKSWNGEMIRGGHRLQWYADTDALTGDATFSSQNLPRL